MIKLKNLNKKPEEISNPDFVKLIKKTDSQIYNKILIEVITKHVLFLYECFVKLLRFLLLKIPPKLYIVGEGR